MLVRLLVSLFIVLSATPTLAIPDWRDTDYIERAFIEIALKNEYRQTDMRLVKWETPIRYQFTYFHLPQNDLVEHLTNAHFEHLEKITYHPIQETKQQANFDIILTKDKHYDEAIQRFTGSKVENIARDSACMAHYAKNKKGAIIRAKIIIPVDHAFSKGLLPACIVEEITQSMGLPNDSDWVNPSIANDASKEDLLTGLDYIMLKLLYNPQLKAGMPLEKVRPIIQSQLLDFKHNGVLWRASRKVNQDGLYPLIH